MKIKITSVAALLTFITGITLGVHLLYPPVLVSALLGYFAYLIVSTHSERR